WFFTGQPERESSESRLRFFVAGLMSRPRLLLTRPRCSAGAMRCTEPARHASEIRGVGVPESTLEHRFLSPDDPQMQLDCHRPRVQEKRQISADKEDGEQQD